MKSTIITKSYLFVVSIMIVAVVVMAGCQAGRTGQADHRLPFSALGHTSRRAFIVDMGAIIRESSTVSVTITYHHVPGSRRRGSTITVFGDAGPKEKASFIGEEPDIRQLSLSVEDQLVRQGFVRVLWLTENWFSEWRRTSMDG